MAKLVLKNPQITVNSVDFSDHISSVEIMLSKDEVDVTNFGSGGVKQRMAGLEDASFTLNFQQDFATAEVDATLYPLWDAETEFPVVVKPSTAAVSASNPSYTGTCIVLEYQPLSGAVGELSETSVEFLSNNGITRATA